MVKPGYKTTEFWVTLITNVITALVLTGLLTQTEAEVLNQATAAMVVGLIALITNGLIVFTYIRSRTDVKLQEQEAIQQYSFSIEPAELEIEVTNDDPDHQ